MTPCTCDQLRDRQDFDDLRDFTEHLRAIQAAGTLVEIPVEVPYANIGEIESWYRCDRCDAVWRLVEPDGPFRGVWRRVETHGTSERPAEAPPGMRFVFVYDTETASFPICYQVTPANGGAYNRSEAPITGSVAEEAASRGADILVLPEYGLSGFGSGVLGFSSGVLGFICGVLAFRSEVLL